MKVYIIPAILARVMIGSLCAYIASTKNRDAWRYFFLGFFLGIIGLIIAAALPKLEAGRGYRKCPRCAEMIRAEALACRFCGIPLEIIDSEKAVTTVKALRESPHCSEPDKEGN